MAPMQFDLTDLRLFVLTAEEGALSRAAAARHLSLAAASARIKALEQQAGMPLLYREARGMRTTPAGEAFLHHARGVLRQTEQLRADLQEYNGGLRGHVRVFANTTSLGEFLPPVLRHYLRRNPDINIDLRERLSHDIVRAVIEGQTDIGIVAGLVRTENLQTLPYRRDRLVLVVPKGHALDGEMQVVFADTLDMDYVGLHESSAIHAFLRQASDHLHRPIKLRIQVGNFETACRMIEAGVGVGVLPESAANRHAQAMDIVTVPLSDVWSVREMLICVRSLDALPSFAQELVQLLVDDAAGRLPQSPEL